MSDKCPHCGETLWDGAHQDGFQWCEQHYEDAETGRLVRLLYERGGSLHRPDLTDSSYWAEDTLGHIIGNGDTAVAALRAAASNLGIETGGGTDE